MEKEHYIREHMKAAGVGIVELSRRMGMHRQTVYTAIDKSSITLQTLHRIAAALDIEAYRLLLPPEETQQKAGEPRQQAATERTTGHTAAHDGQEEARPGIYTRCICPHCHTVLRLIADEWRQPPEGDDTQRRQAAARHTAGHTEGRGASRRARRRQREQGESRQAGKRVCNIFKGEKGGKTPMRLAKACKCVYIHFTQYRGVWAVYCTFFFIYIEGVYNIYLYI